MSRATARGPTGSGGTIEVRRLEGSDFEAYLSLRDTSFGYPGGDDVRRTLSRRLEVTWGAYRDGALGATLADPRFDVLVAGTSVPLVGIAAVQTAPEHRRQGLAALLMRRALEEARADGIGWSTLYPFDPRFYTGYGWQGLPTGVRLEFPLDTLPQRPVPAAMTRIERDLRSNLHDLRLRCIRAWSLANTRTRGPWDVWEDLAPEGGARRVVYRSDDAYLVADQSWAEDRPGVRLQVVDAAAAGRAGRDQLLGMLGTFRGQAHVAVIDLPSDDALAWDWSGWFAMRKRPTLMARIVDVESALSRLRAIRLGEAGDEPLDLAAFAVRVRDDFAPWNQDAFRVEPSEAGCMVSRIESAATVVDVRGVALLATGAATPAAVVRAGLAEGPLDALAGLAALSGDATPYAAPEDAF